MGRFPELFVTRRSISWAALLVNVSAQIFHEGTPDRIRYANRSVRVVVFPVPAPATIKRGEKGASDAARC